MLNCESATLNLYLFIYLFNILFTYKAYLKGDLDFVKLPITWRKEICPTINKKKEHICFKYQINIRYVCKSICK